MTPFKFEEAGMNTASLTIPTFVKPKKKLNNNASFIKPHDISFVLRGCVGPTNVEQTVLPSIVDTTYVEVVKWKTMVESFYWFLDNRNVNLRSFLSATNHTVESYVDKFIKDDKPLRGFAVQELGQLSFQNPDTFGPVEMKYIKALFSLVHCQGYCGIEAVSVYKPIYQE